jgi:predicted permease
LKTLDTGFQPKNVLLIEIGPHDQRREADLATRLMERILAIPGVQSATVSVNTPLGNFGSGVNGLEIPGYTPQTEEDQKARGDWVGPGYFETLGVPILQGREFSITDTVAGGSVVVINETMSRHYFGDQPAVGRRLRFNKREYEIVGVARDTKYTDLRGSTPRMLYFAFLQNPSVLNTLELRTAGPPLEFAGAVRQAIRDVDARLNIRDIASMSGLIDRKLLPEYLVALMSGFFSSLILSLACIGIYGTLAFTVARRTNEIGIRMALGARRTSVLVMILADILRPLVVGVVLGILIVMALGPLLSSMLFGLQANDAATIAFAVVLLTVVALAAGYIPGRRASRVDPVAALRFE